MVEIDKLTDKEKIVLLFISRNKLKHVSDYGRFLGSKGINQKEIDSILKNLVTKKLIVRYQQKRYDFINAWKYHMKGKLPEKKYETCSLSVLGNRVVFNIKKELHVYQ